MTMTETALAQDMTDSRAAIVEAAAACFMHRGYEKTTIDDIADALGSTKGRIYHHFRSKSAVFFAVYRQAMTYCFDAVEPLAHQKAPAAPRLQQMCIAHALVMMHRLSFQRGIKLGLEIYMRGATTEAERRIFLELTLLRDRYEALFRQVLMEGNRDGTLDTPDVPLASRLLLSALNGIPDWYRATPQGEDPDRIAVKMAQMLLSGLQTRPD